MADWSQIRKCAEQQLEIAETMLIRVGGDPAPKAKSNGKSGSQRLTATLVKGAARREKLLALQGRVDSLRKRYMRRG